MKKLFDMWCVLGLLLLSSACSVGSVGVDAPQKTPQAQQAGTSSLPPAPTCTSDDQCILGVCKDGLCSCYEPSQQACSLGLSVGVSRCYDLSKERLHCGACGNGCKSDEACVEGQCQAPACPAQESSCAGICTALQRDPQSCGKCDYRCATGPGTTGPNTCVQGICQSRCQPGWTLHKGPYGERCLDLQSDPNNCGKVDHRCPGLGRVERPVCIQGSCAIACVRGWEHCDGECVLLSRNVAHCGACGKTCKDAQRCQEGACVPR